MFFHKIANRRRRINTIHSMEDDTGTTHGEQHIHSHFYNYFKWILGQSQKGHLTLSNNCWKLSTDLTSLENPPFHRGEGQESIVRFRPRQSLGLDGFPIVFFTPLWSIIKEDLIKLFCELHNNSARLDRINYSQFVLIKDKKTLPKYSRIL